MLKRGMIIIGMTAMWLGLTGFASLGNEGRIPGMQFWKI